MYDDAVKYLKQMFGKQASFRGGQWEAIELALNNKKALIIQQTGWGKSIVYFIATKILRNIDFKHKKVQCTYPTLCNGRQLVCFIIFKVYSALPVITCNNQ